VRYAVSAGLKNIKLSHGWQIKIGSSLSWLLSFTDYSPPTTLVQMPSLVLPVVSGCLFSQSLPSVVTVVPLAAPRSMSDADRAVLLHNLLEDLQTTLGVVIARLQVVLLDQNQLERLFATNSTTTSLPHRTWSKEM
jgi:hypothetical protein